MLAWAAVQVSLRAVETAGSGRLAWIQSQLDEQQGSSPIPSLRRAVELSPREAIYHSRLGLALEVQGDFKEAEQELVKGGEFSKKYEPRWDLLNFYFRRAQWDRFWPVAADALQISWGDRAPLFELALQAQGGQAQLHQVLPAKREVRFSYAVFLVSKGDMKDAAPFVFELSKSSLPEERTTFIYRIDLQLEKFMVREAVETWKALGEAGDPFPWKPGRLPGVTVHSLEGEGWQILFNGNEPEHCVLLESVKPVTPGAYHLSASMEEKLSPPGGLLWHIETLEASPRSLNESFTAGPGVEAVRIRLEYQRLQGSGARRGARFVFTPFNSRRRSEEVHGSSGHSCVRATHAVGGDYVDVGD